MKARLASIAFLLGAVATGSAWLTLLPMVGRLVERLSRYAPPGSPEQQLLGRIRGTLPFWLVLNLAVLTFVVFLVLDLTVGRPLRRTEAIIEELGRIEHGPFLARRSAGPLLARVQRSLQRMDEALREERVLTASRLSALEAANARLVQAQAELVSSERLATVGRLAAGVAHEVGNPLSGILGYLALARTRGQPSAELLGYLDRVEQEIMRIDGIVRNLLDLGRPATAPTSVLLEPLVGSCVQLVRAGAEFEAVEISAELEPAAIPRAEPGGLAQVLINLLINAAQAMRGQGRIRIRAEQHSQWVVIEVSDNGPGIAEDVLPRLFEPFFTTKATGQGTGLGLAVSRHLVTTMGGSLQATNAPEGGATFRVRLPAANA